MNKGLYIHYPFCASKCLYCDFYSLADLKKREEYEKSLVLALESLSCKDLCVDTVFFGGGTPTLMTQRGREKIFSCIRENFALSENAEITIETNPVGALDPDVLEHFFLLGTNRLSIGAQSFHEKELGALGRRHSAQDIVKTVERAREVGFENISLDLMMRTPRQTKDSFLENIQRALSLPITHLSVYGLSIEERTALGVMQKRGESLNLADEDTESEMYLEASRLLSENSFSHYEISNFAKEGFESRHNLKYWRGEEYIGVGASAHGYLDSVRYSYPRSIKAFCQNPLKREGEEFISEEEKLREKILLGLRLSRGVDFSKLPIELTPSFINLTDKLSEAGLLAKENGKISLTPKGFLISNTIIFQILETLFEN